MSREEYLSKIKQIITTKNSAGNIHQNNFRNYDYGEMTPINANIITRIRNLDIILNEEMYSYLLELQKLTNETNQEFKFILHGKKRNYNQIEFTEFILYNNQINFISLYKEIIIHLFNKIKKGEKSKLFVCLGHTNSSIRDFEESFTLGDFADYMMLYQNNPFFKKYQIEVTGCLLTNSNNINFMLYESINNNFQKFINVFVEDAKGRLKNINSFDPKEQIKRFLKKQN